jgi:REP element-mobilizing transposase RayT
VMFKDVAVNQFTLQLWEIMDDHVRLVMEITEKDMPVPASLKQDVFCLDPFLTKAQFSI